jgi:uridylate kinase
MNTAGNLKRLVQGEKIGSLVTMDDVSESMEEAVDKVQASEASNRSDNN